MFLRWKNFVAQQIVDAPFVFPASTCAPSCTFFLRSQLVHKLIVESMDLSVLSAYAMGVGRFLEECRRGVEPWCNDQDERDELAKGAVAVSGRCDASEK